MPGVEPGAAAPGPALFVVRAEVRRDLLADFDRWYETEHLPDVIRELGARRGTRYWSTTDGTVHFAIYEFDDLDHLQQMVASPALTGLVAEFDRNWPDGVVRSREVLRPVQTLPGRAP